jgi:twitching motility protein PilT
VDAATLIERLVRAGREKGGDRIELAVGRPAILVRGLTRLQAGRAVLDASELESWLEANLPKDRWLVLQLGQRVSGAATVEGGTVEFSASSGDSGYQVAIRLEERPAEVSAPTPEPAAVPEPAPTHAPSIGAATAPAVLVERSLDRMLATLVEQGGSDLHLCASAAPMMRLHGEMQPLPGFSVPLESDHVLLLCDDIAPAANRAEFRAASDTDFAYEIPGLARFRANLFRDRRGVGAVFRQIPSRILSMAELGLPECAEALCSLSKGLVLVTGPTGSGKSTTLAAMVDRVNSTRSEHIITIEDPIEFVHENKRCLVNQREVFTHTESFKRALRAALREDPDVVLVGELRDLETVAIAVETAETGHLVFGTLHTTTAMSTVDRMVDQFPADRQAQIRVMLSESLKGVISQTLLKRTGGGRVAAFEVLLGVPAVANLIREGKTFQLPTVMQTNRRLGMRMMNDSLAELVRGGVVALEEALARSTDREALRAMVKGGRPEPAKA